MKLKVYVETSIVSYITARPNRDVIITANQLLAREWWEKSRPDFDLYVSELVLAEAGKGNSHMAKERLELIENIQLLDIDENVVLLAEEIKRRNILPAKAEADISHLAIAAVHEVDFLLTLNCKHIANAFIFRRIEKVFEEFGYEPPIVCTPQEILGKENELNEG